MPVLSRTKEAGRKASARNQQLHAGHHSAKINFKLETRPTPVVIRPMVDHPLMPWLTTRPAAVAPPETIEQAVSSVRVLVERSRASLHDALAKCVAIHERVESNLTDKQQLRDLCKREKVAYTGATHPLLAIAKLVVRHDDKLASRYGRALQLAVEQRIKAVDIPAFLANSKGGIAGCATRFSQLRPKRRGKKAAANPTSAPAPTNGAEAAAQKEDVEAAAQRDEADVAQCGPPVSFAPAAALCYRTLQINFGDRIMLGGTVGADRSIEVDELLEHRTHALTRYDFCPM